MQPLDAAIGANSLEIEPPAEKMAKSKPESKEDVVNSWTTYSLFKKVIFLPLEREDAKKVYSKIVDNKIYKMQNSNPVEFKNIIIELIHDTALGDGTARRNINTVGTGKGYYITNGQVEEITWSKSSRRANTVYKKNDGTELVINPGKTIINLISPSYELVIE